MADSHLEGKLLGEGYGSSLFPRPSSLAAS